MSMDSQERLNQKAGLKCALYNAVDVFSACIF